MKKNYSNKLSKRLGQYGSLAVALTGLSEANSQVIYTDVNPDYSGSLGSSYAIDFDNDGVDDIILQNSVSSSQSYYFSSFIRALYANPQGDNEVLGSGSGGFTYPYALNSGNMISSNADGVFFNNSNTNSLNWNYGFSYFGYTYSVNDGNWVGVTDKYLGVKFDISGETHYGWVRLDVNEDSSFIVKDFAYEATPNTGILAGDQGEDISCAAPTALTVDNVTENTVTFSWTASPDETDGYDWALFAEGANIDTDTPIATGSVGTGMLNATVEGLDPETTYDIYVQTMCTSETSSDWEGPQTFTTDNLSTRNFESLDDLSLYPNPVSSILTIESKNSITAIEIYNLLGQKVYQVQVNKINPELDMSLLEKGTYFIKVYKNKICKNFKIIKE